ncbi:MAG: FKBP-type peptidyl-prolyl cis-trans isomerase [Bacteroidota bacterium]
MNHRPLPLMIWIAGLLALLQVGCADTTNPYFQPPDFSTVPELPDTTQLDMIHTQKDLQVYRVKEGSGKWTIQGRTGEGMNGYITIRLNDDENTVLQSTYADGSTTSEQVTTSDLIDPRGLLEGVIGMKQGERRIIVVGPSMGFADADRSSQFYTYRDETFVYDVEVDLIHF